MCVRILYVYACESYIPVVVPSGSDFGHAVFAVRVIGFSSLGVLESAATNTIDSNEEDEHDNVENRELVPVPCNVFENTSFA